MEEKWKGLSANMSCSVQSTSQMPESLSAATREMRHKLSGEVKLQMERVVGKQGDETKIIGDCSVWRSSEECGGEDIGQMP
jgi:hypothetical protein